MVSVSLLLTGDDAEYGPLLLPYLLHIGFAVLGADMATQAIDAFASAFTSAVDAAADFELLKKSMASLSAVELVDRGKFADIGDAYSTAQAYADQFYQTQALAAAQSPFSLDDISGALKTASTYGFLATQIESVAQAQELGVITAQRLSQAMLDTVAGTGQQGRVVGELVEIVGRANVSGRYLQEDANMLLDRGVKFYDILADRLGKTSAEIKKMQTEGKLTAQMVNAELIPALEKMYGGSAAKAGDTIAGRMATFGDAMMFRSLDTFEPAIKTLSDALGDVNDHLMQPETVAAAERLGEGINSVAEAGLALAPVLVTAADVTASMVVPALYAAGAAALMSGTQYVASGKAAAALSMHYRNLASSATYAARSMSLASGLTIAAAGSALAFAYADQQVTKQTDTMATSLYETTAGAQAAAQAMKLYGALSTETQVKLTESYDQLVAMNKDAKAAFTEDAQNAARSGLFQSQEEAARITANNALIRSAAITDVADALIREAEASKSAYDAALLLAVAEEKNIEVAKARAKAIEAATKTRDSLIENERSLQNALYDLEIEKATKLYDARQTYRDARDAAQTAYDDAEVAAKAAHDEAIADLWQKLHTSVIDETLGYQQELTDIRKDYDAKELAQINDHNADIADLRNEWADTLKDANETARIDAISALDSLADTDVDFYRGAEDRLAEWNAKRELLAKQGASCKVDEERKAFADAEAEAARHYLEQEQQQRESLGRQLIDFTIAQALKNDVSAQAMQEMITGISTVTGLYDSTSAALIGNTFAGIQGWAQSGGAGAGSVLANIQALPAAAAQARLEQDRLTDSMVNNAASAYMASGDIEAYQRSLTEIPTNVATQMGIAQAPYDTTLLDQHQAHLDAVEAAQQTHNDAMAALEAERQKDAQQASLDYAKSIGATLFEKGLSQQDVSAFLANDMPRIVSEVQGIQDQFNQAVSSGTDPAAAAVQYAYAMNASEYAKLTGKAGGEAVQAHITELDAMVAATETRTQAMTDAWNAYRTTIEVDVPAWYINQKTQVVNTHAQQAAELIAQLDNLTAYQRTSMIELATSEGQHLFRFDRGLQDELRKLVRSGAEGDAFYREYAKLTDRAGVTLDMSTGTVAGKTKDIVTQTYITQSSPTIVVDSMKLTIDGREVRAYVSEITTRTLEDDYNESNRNGGLRRR